MQDTGVVGLARFDCSDLVAQMLVQSLSDMKPEVDFEMRAKSASTNSLNHRTKMMDDWVRNRKSVTTRPDFDDFVGCYWNNDLEGLI